MKLGPFRLWNTTRAHNRLGVAIFNIHERMSYQNNGNVYWVGPDDAAFYNLTAQEAGALALALEHSSTYGEAFALFDQLRRNMLWSQP